MPIFFNVVFASGVNREFGYQGKLPWTRIPEDVEHFHRLVDNNVVIMGYKTYLSMIKLKNPFEIIVIREKRKRNEVIEHLEAVSLTQALHTAKNFGKKIFVIGGVGIIRQALMNLENSSCILEYVYHTFIKEKNLISDVRVSLDILFILQTFDILEVKHTEDCVFTTYKVGIKTQERVYLDLVKEVLEKGEERGDRTGVGVLSSFGKNLEFNLQNEFPLLTTRKISWKEAAKELLFFISGKTDIYNTPYGKLKWWEANTSNEFLKGKLPEGNIGPCYGYQWRHAGAHFNPEGSEGGVDQLQNVIDTIKKDPYSRRLMISSWVPHQIEEMALPPCCCQLQFYVEKNFLNLQVYQRSADLMIGVPNNITEYGFLLIMVANLTGLTPNRLIFVFGDVHIYKNCIDQAKELLKRSCRPLPKCKIVEKENIDSYKLEDISIEEYHPHPSIKFEMAV